MELNEKLLEILACPRCKDGVTLQGGEIICMKCRVAYPVRDGIPVMLIDEARALEDE
ncbi:MAG: Trm112 family protein [Desulfuromonadales bacterium]|nr:Trm112 family protein [Desulfuromonadales bacterium]